MLNKTWNHEIGRYVVVFDLPAGLEVDHAAVVGDFNDWRADAHVMQRTDDGRLEVAVSLEPGTRARFRYRVDGDRWENDWNADDYVPNEFGGEDSLLVVPDAPPEVEPVAANLGPARKTAKKEATTKKRATKKKTAKKKAAAKKAAKKKAAAKKAGTEKTAKKATGKRAAPRKSTGDGSP